MGITGLLPFLSNIQKKVHVSQYSGRCVAVDTSCWLHRGAFSCAFELATGQPTTRYVNYIVKRIKLLLYHKIYPVMVFDGCNAPSKKNTNEKRRELRQANRDKGVQLLAEGNKSGAADMFQKAISISNDMVHEVIKECNAMNVPVVVAPYEADAQIAYLVKSGVVDFAITEDSDLLPFGCQKVLFKMDEQGNAFEIDLSDLGKTTEEPRFDGWSIDKFRQMCIVSGCDYLDRLPKCGLKTVHKQFRKFNNVDRGIKAFIANHNMKNSGNIDTKGYYEKFLEAEKAFKHHLIFDPASQTIKPLNPLPSHVELKDLPFLGEVFDKARAVEQACGNVNPQTGERVGSFPPNHRKLLRSCEEWRETKGSGTTLGVSDVGGDRGGVKTGGWGSAITAKDISSKYTSEPSTLCSWTPTTKSRTPSTSTAKRSGDNTPTITQMSMAEGEDDLLVKIYGSGKRRKIIPSTTEQRSCYFRKEKDSGEEEEEEEYARSNTSNTCERNSNGSCSNPFAKTKNIGVVVKQMLGSDPENSVEVSERKLFFANDGETANPFRKDRHSKENIPVTNHSSPKKFESVLTRPSHIVSSYSSAINLQRTLSDKLSEEPVKSRSPELSKIPSPIKSTPLTCGLARKPSQSNNKPVQINGNKMSNKWVSTLAKNEQKSVVKGVLGTKTRPIKIGLLPKSKTGKQKTLNAFIKSPSKPNDGTKSKYFS